MERNFSATRGVYQIMRAALAVTVAAMLIAGCGQAATTVARPSVATAEVPQPQPFNLFTHCGILTTYFARRTFYLAELYPARVLFAADPGRPEVRGTMTLLSPPVAAFVDRKGNRVLFVDEFPGALNVPYPFAVRVMSGGNQLSDEQFAGRHWHTGETLPGVKGPPYGDGQDRFTTVAGTFTIIDSDDAVFRSQAGAVLHFTALSPAGCD